MDYLTGTTVQYELCVVYASMEHKRQNPSLLQCFNILMEMELDGFKIKLKLDFAASPIFHNYS